MRIYIVDDSDILRRRLKRLIYTVPDIVICGESNSIEDAVRSIKTLTPDLVIIDIQLPSGLGFEVFDKTVSDEYRPRWIVLTNYPTQQYQQMCADRQIKYFFDKTEDFEKIVETIHSLKQNEAKKHQYDVV